jgi:hypothetical protein
MTALAYFPDVEIEPGIYFASEPAMFGNAFWRVIVRDSLAEPKRCHAYQWRLVGDLPIWQDHSSWPAFDMMRQDCGLPSSLARLYTANEVAIKEAIIGWHL